MSIIGNIIFYYKPLIGLDADKEAKGIGKTPLEYAVMKGQKGGQRAVVEYLVGLGADMKVAGSNGDTLLSPRRFQRTRGYGGTVGWARRG